MPNGVSIDSLPSVFEMKNGIIALPFNHNDIFNGNESFLFVIHHNKMVGGNNSIIFHERYLFNWTLLDIFIEYLTITKIATTFMGKKLLIDQ